MKTKQSTISRKTGEDRKFRPLYGRGQRSALSHPLQRFNAPTLQRTHERGIALVITLILLAVTLVMAIAFLAISRRERGSVSTYSDMATAKYAADAALAKAENRIVSQILTTTNPYVFSLMVSTNYINPTGFFRGVANPTNVNYAYYAPGGPVGALQTADLEQNIANLFYDPRPPVFYGSNDFRYYLDLNRNGRYDTNGVVIAMDNEGNALLNTNGTPIYLQEVGDPEWIGILEHPDQPHGPNNPFIARFCYLVVPANSLDLNFDHNQALNPAMQSGGSLAGGDGYFRNQNVGTWENNLAAFLADLNTNIWDPQGFGNQYQYRQPAEPNLGYAFNDAFSLLTNRYANLYALQPSVQKLYGANGVNAFEDDGIDAYTIGPLQNTFDINYSPYNYAADFWVGADNTNNFFTPDDLFNTNKTAGFGIRLQNAGVNVLNADGTAGTTVSTYDRYTFYRMLAQLGTDTAPAQGKINLNYQNAVVNYDFNSADVPGTVATNISIIPNYETNFISWQPQDFFTAAANQLLQAYTKEWFELSPSNYMQNYFGITEPYYTNLDGLGVTNIQYYGQINQIPSFGITNIPVYMFGSFVYTPAVNRLLQLAANIYDSTTNSMTGISSNYPSVFRPVFWKTNEYNYFLGRYYTNIYIRGYQYVQEPVVLSSSVSGSLADTILSTPFEVTDPRLPFGYSVTNVWGVPWIVGAKKAFPNFNGFELDDVFFIERKLQFTRSNITANEPRTYTTNQMYMMGISNSFAMDDWNSYATAYNNPVTVYGQDILSVGLTNNQNFSITNLYSTNVAQAYQPWYADQFMLPFGTNVTIMQNLNPNSPPSTNSLYMYYTNSTAVTFGGYSFKGPCFIPNSLNPTNYLDAGTPPLPQFGLTTTNHLQAFMLDTTGGNIHILDYVQLGSMNSSLNVNQAISDPDENGLWSTNFYSSSTTPVGVVNQYLTSLNGNVPTEDQDGGGGGGQWVTTPVPGAGTDTTPPAQQALFSAFFAASDTAPYAGAVGGYVTNLEPAIQAPFTPMREIVQRYVYQANDPLVHYLTSDLNDFVDDTSNKVNITAVQTNILTTIGKLSDRYMPWGNQSPKGGLSGNQMPGAINGIPVDTDPYNLEYKDPLVWTSDNWDFPTNKYPTVGWLGRVHRGTPWQSVYLKSPDLWSVTQSSSNGVQNMPEGQETWQVWTGNPNADDAYNEDPLRDRLLFDLFTATPDDDATRGQVSVNIGADPNNPLPPDPLAGLASWSALLSGTPVFSNDAPNLAISHDPGSESPSPIYGEGWPSNTVLINQPMGVATNISALWAIVQGINSTRTNFPGLDGLKGVFEHVGDILAVPQLSVSSPFLNQSTVNQQEYGISDEMYEWLPQQMLGLMTVSGTPQNPPRYVVYCYGQTLKPAPGGYVASPGQFFGLYTNYQVVAESAARVVIQVQNAPTPANPGAMPHVQVVQYNTLPPD
ncbi:MAG TPA: hypothetical protein VMF08_00065 [Candidatus Sulfotelmatobacter sp.]|nr:hypothetical protein [Candidatus Sulfotelmatobacter sp.]